VDRGIKLKLDSNVGCTQSRLSDSSSNYTTAIYQKLRYDSIRFVITI